LEVAPGPVSAAQEQVSAVQAPAQVAKSAQAKLLAAPAPAQVASPLASAYFLAPQSVSVSVSVSVLIRPWWGITAYLAKCDFRLCRKSGIGGSH
jgi:hypothetical protein